MVKVLMASKWHVHAVDYAKQIQAEPDAEITCVYDEDPTRGQAWADELGVPFEPDLAKALARPDVDAVIVDSPTTDHKRVMVAAANAGKHIFTEKALATTVEDCNAIAEAITKSGVKFCISLRELSSALIQYCKGLIDSGKLGKIHYMRYRDAHAGTLHGWLPEYWYDLEKAGGGVLLDLGCHPMYSAPYLLGKPKRIASIQNTTYAPKGVDDNAVCVVEFENNAIAVLETSFISPYDAGCFELLGTEGAVVAIGKEVKVRTKDNPDEWVKLDELPPALPTAMRLWLDGIINGSPIPYDLERGTLLTSMIQNAYISNNEGRIVNM